MTPALSEDLIAVRRGLSRIMAPVFLVLAVILGGSREGVLTSAALQVFAAAVLLALLFSPRTIAPSRSAKLLLALFALFVGLALLQLVPLPPDVWARLPGREPVVEGFAALGEPLPVLPLSMAPAETIQGLLTFLPAIAGFFLVAGLGPAKTGSGLAIGLAVATALSCLVGVVQIATGANSPLYFYAFTNWGNPVGFFANVNHQATLCLMTFPFLAVLVGRLRLAFAVGERDYARLVLLTGLGLLAPLGVMIAGSGAGYGLFGPTLIASLFLLRTKTPGRGGVLLLLVLALALAGLGNLVASSPILENLGIPSPMLGPGSRTDTWQRTFEAFKDTFPVGAGFGAFTALFPAYEDPFFVTRTVWNNAHNDYIEFALEMGAPGVCLMVLLLGWIGWRSVIVWTRSGAEIAPYARAASIALLVVIAHSVVDYPLRTGAVASLSAMCLALLSFDPASSAATSRRRRRERGLAHAHVEL